MKPCKLCSKEFEPKSPRHQHQKFCSTACCRKHYQLEHPDKHLEATRKHRKNNPEMTYWYQIKYQYGITKENYEKMLVLQKHACAICKLPESHKVRDKIRPLSVDHNHETGQVRKLLCHNCNSALGLLKEDPIIMANMIKYIQED